MEQLEQERAINSVKGNRNVREYKAIVDTLGFGQEIISSLCWSTKLQRSRDVLEEKK